MVFSEVAFQISSEKQVCSANMPRSTVRPPSHQVNFVPPALLSLFHLLSEASVDICFLSCKRWRFDGQDSFINLPFWFHVPHLWVNTPTAEAKYKNNNSIHLKFYFRTTAHTGIAQSRGMNARCAENVRVSNWGHRP